MATDYEKKYKEALERAKRLTSDMTTLQKIREFIFPELAESEDERIRKCLCDIVNWLGFDSSFFLCNGVAKTDVLAYLEKQKEKASIPDELVENYKHFCEQGGRDVAAIINAGQ